MFFLCQKKCYSLSFSILGGHNSTNAWPACDIPLLHSYACGDGERGHNRFVKIMIIGDNNDQYGCNGCDIYYAGESNHHDNGDSDDKGNCGDVSDSDGEDGKPCV